MNQVIQNMNGGTGETSYAFNSSVQKKAFYKTKPKIEEAELDIFSKFCTCSTTMTGKSMPIGIADLGCSSGPNTLFSYLLNIIYKKCCEFDIVSPEIVMYFNDLPGNDFNTLFKYLESFCDELKRNKGDGFGQCFDAGIPGTFYGRLVPRDTLHFVHSSYSLQWFSQVSSSQVPLILGTKQPKKPAPTPREDLSSYSNVSFSSQGRNPSPLLKTN